MIRYFCCIIIICYLFSGCFSGPSERKAEQSSKMLEQVKERLAEKKKVDELRQQLLRSRMGRSIEQYTPIIKKYAKRYGFDWRLIVAQIVQESGFQVKARSRVGASGLMQIMPGTAKALSRELDIEYISRNPRENITAGIYHLYKQKRLFLDAEIPERTKLALASYNCGVGRIFDAQKITGYYNKSLNHWNTVSPHLTMLKKSDWQLHLQVWPNGRPRYGYFYGFNETINYVDNIWALYQFYQKIM
jgi:membrane-bound lytic murein transglycosylase F